MRFLLLTLFSCSLVTVSAQALLVQPAQVTFAATDELSRDSIELTLTNPWDEPLDILETRLYEIYGVESFSAVVEKTTLLAQESITAKVYFSPNQNINYNSEWLIITSKGGVRVDLRGQGTFSKTYYASTQNLSEQALKQALKTRLGQGYNNLGYSGARNEMFNVIDNQRTNGQGAGVNTLEGVYTGFLVTGYANRTEAQNQGMNTEHTWPQSLFDGDEPMRADLHHIFPTNQGANSTRANFPFGNVSNPSWQQGGSKLGGGVFEPRDVQKGATARAMLYFVLRYQNYDNYLNSQEATLRSWHQDFPPSAIDIRRNDDIASVQGNRNPFVDYPQLLDRINSISTNSVAPEVRGYDLPFANVDMGIWMAGDTARFTYLWANTGNQPIQISGISLTNASEAIFGLESGPDTTIQPGEAWELVIYANAQSSGDRTVTLAYTTDVPGQESQQVPIEVSFTPSSSIQSSLYLHNWQILPNPSSGFVEIQFEGPQAPMGEVQLLDLQGRTVWQDSLNSALFRAEFTGIPNGMYVLQLPDGQLSRLLIRRK